MGKGRVGKVGRAGLVGRGKVGRALATRFVQFPLTLSSRRYKVCCARETADRAASWGSSATAWNMEARNMRKCGVQSSPVWAMGLFFTVPSS